MFPSYRNQSVDLQSKSTDWFFMMGTLVVKGLSELSHRYGEVNGHYIFDVFQNISNLIWPVFNLFGQPVRFQETVISTSNHMVSSAINDKFDKW